MSSYHLDLPPRAFKEHLSDIVAVDQSSLRRFERPIHSWSDGDTFEPETAGGAARTLTFPPALKDKTELVA